MPIYEIECKECGRQEIYSPTYISVEISECPVCGTLSPRRWDSVGRPEWFTPYYTEALSTDRIYVDSKKTEKSLEKKHKVYRDS